jgi:hypothetical protein
LVKIVSWVKFLSPTLSLIILSLERPKMELMLLRWLIHLMEAQMSFGCLSILWLTFKHPSWIGYHQVLELVNRYMEMHWILGSLEMNYISHLMSRSFRLVFLIICGKGAKYGYHCSTSRINVISLTSTSIKISSS